MIRLRLLPLFCLAAPGLALADQLPLWEAGVGAALLTLPDYRGADQQRGYLLPIPYFVYRGERLKVDREALRGLLARSERWELELSANGTPPVDSSHNHAREGMPDLHPTAELGGSLKLKLSPDRWLGAEPTLTLPLRSVFTVERQPRDIGATAALRLNLDWDADNGWKRALQLGPSFATQRYHGYFYSVPEAYATAARPAYRASGGYDGMQLTLSTSKRSGKWWFGAFARADDLHGTPFADSPLVRRKSTLSAGLALSWLLAESGERVEADD